MKYFTIEELCYSRKAEANHIDNTPTEEIKYRLKELVDNILDPLREYIGHPIIISSGYRNDAVNRLNGGSPTSAHLEGYAADIIVREMSANTLWNVVLKFCKDNNIKYDQIYYETDGRVDWCHIGYKHNDMQRMQNGKWYKK